MFIQPNVSYGSLGKSVMPTTFRLGDAWLHENQINHHKTDIFGLNLCNQGMIFFLSWRVVMLSANVKSKLKLIYGYNKELQLNGRGAFYSVSYFLTPPQ